jgi:Haemolymph juvenile hormone binding protein (JHBP)
MIRKEKLLICHFFIFLSATEIEKCSYGDVECIKKQMNTAVKVFAKGNSKLNLAPLDPVEIDGFEIVQGGNGPINLAMNFKNAKIFGVSNAEVTKVR